MRHKTGRQNRRLFKRLNGWLRGQVYVWRKKLMAGALALHAKTANETFVRSA